MVWLDTEYLSNAGETVQTVIVGNTIEEGHYRVIYVHYKNGYYSLIEGINNLMAFLNGDASERFACVETENEVIDVLKSI